jgi:hypothetical protein
MTDNLGTHQQSLVLVHVNRGQHVHRGAGVRIAACASGTRCVPSPQPEHEAGALKNLGLARSHLWIRRLHSLTRQPSPGNANNQVRRAPEPHHRPSGSSAHMPNPNATDSATRRDGQPPLDITRPFLDDNTPSFKENAYGFLPCAREDSNLHELSAHKALNLARLPIPPQAQRGEYSPGRGQGGGACIRPGGALLYEHMFVSGSRHDDRGVQPQWQWI